MGGGLFKLPYTLGILILLISVISVSYAYFNASETQEHANVINTKCFEVSMASEGEEITLNEAYPVTDEEGKNQKGYTFTIKNTCNTKASYEVNLEELEVTKKLSSDHIKVSINESKGSIVGELKTAEPTIKDAEESHTLTSGSLNPDESKQYTIKLWMDEDTPATEETMEAEYKSKVSITNTYEENTENNITIAYESSEKDYVQESERIKVKGTSPKYNIIEYSFDNLPYERVKQESQTVEEEIEVTDENKIYPFTYRDEKGNEKIENITPIMLDQTGPSIEIKESTIKGGALLEITFTDNKSGLKEYYIDDENVTSLNEKTETKEVTIPENKNIIIHAKDKLNNETIKNYEVTKVDKENPTLIVKNPKENDWTNESVTIELSAEDDMSGIEKFYYQTESNPNWIEIEPTIEDKNGTGSLTIDTNVNETYTFKVMDKSGNESETKSTIVKIDKEEPTYKNVDISNINYAGYEVYIHDVIDTFSQIKSVQFTTWTETEPSNKITQEGEQQENNTWYYKVDMEKFNHNIGKYYTSISILDNAGNETKIEDQETTVPGIEVTYDYNDPKNYAVVPGNGLFINGFTGKDNDCYNLYQFNTAGLKVGDKMTISMDIEYANLTADTSQNYLFYPQGLGNISGWDANFTGTYLKLTGTGVYHYESTITLTSKMLENEYFDMNLRTNYYTGGSLLVKNFEIKKANDPKNYAANTGNGITINNFSGKYNLCNDLYKLYVTGLSVGDKMTISMDINYTNLIADTSQNYLFYPQGLGNISSWDANFTGTYLKLTGTGVYHYESTITLTSKMLENEYFDMNLRTDYYTGGSIEIRNFEIKRTNKITEIKPFNTPLGTLPTISESGNYLTGWYTEKQGGNPITKESLTPSSNVTYYGQYTDTVTPSITLNGTVNSSEWTTSNNTLTASVNPKIAGSTYAYTWYQVPEYHYQSKTDWNVVEKQESNGSKYWNVTYNKTSGTTSSWQNVQFPTYTYVVGKTYRFHFKIRINQMKDLAIELRHSLVYNDYGIGLTRKLFTNVTNGWIEGILTRTIPQTSYTNDGTVYESTDFSPRIEIWTEDLKLDDKITSRSVDFDFKDFWVEEVKPGTNAQIKNNIAVKLTNNNLTRSFTNDINAWYIVQVGTGSGQTATSNKYQVLVDKTAPNQEFTLSSSEILQNNWYKSVNITVTGKDQTSDVVSGKYCTGNSACTPNKSITGKSVTITLENGENSIVCANFINGVGIESETSCSNTYKIDKDPPTLDSVTITADGTNITATIKNATDAISQVKTYVFKLSDGTTGTSTTPTYTFLNVNPGQDYTVEAYVIDNAGNASGSKTSNQVHINYNYWFDWDNTGGNRCPQKGDLSTYSVKNNVISMHSESSITQSCSTTIFCTINFPTLVNPELSFDYTFTPSTNSDAGFTVYTNNRTLFDQTQYHPITESINQTLSGEITYITFYLDSWSTNSGDVTISNIRVNGVPVTLADS